MAKMSSYIRIIGDCHGNLTHRKKGRSYKNLIQKIPYSVQLGDLSLDYSGLKNIDAVQHRVIAGNHDNYDQLTPHFLGDFGFHAFPLPEGEFRFFFIRGAYSIDKAMRIPGRSWWHNEELDWEQGYKLIPIFQSEKPEIVLSHDCPQEVFMHLIYDAPYKMPGNYSTSRTSALLQNCFEAHKPKLWIFGHHHKQWRKQIKGTTFICLDGDMSQWGHEIGFVDFNQEGKLL